MRQISLILFLFACNSEPGQSEMKRPPLGMAIQTTMNNWSWVDFPDSSCDDGSATGIGVNQGSSNNLLVFMNGGGACWDYETCFVIKTASKGPFGAAEFNGMVGKDQKNTIFDRNDASNPFKDWSYVFVPYCTGDLHAGDNVVTYMDNMGMDPHTYHHAGHKNILAYVSRIAGTWPAPDKLVVSGSSAGGYGTAMNFDTFRQFWPTGKLYMLDDSGPVLEGSAIPDGYRMAWLMEWNLAGLLAPLCGTSCNDDFSKAVTLLANKYPKDRMGLLSSEQDQTIRGYLLLSPTGFQGELNQVTMDVFDKLPNYKHFYVDGQTHTMLGNIGNFSSKGMALENWLTQMVSDDPTWSSLQP
jgi:hypothetical protein